MSDPIYLDYAATTPLDPRVRDVMLACMDNRLLFGNPSAVTHSYGRRAAELVDDSAESVARLINCSPQNVIWTSGATEANNLAIIGAARFRAMHGKHIVTTAIEHKSVLESCRWLESQGYEVTYVHPDPSGIVPPEAIEEAVRADTALVSVMHANNETGVIQDVAAIGAICRSHGAWFHVDAAQSLGKLTIDLDAMQIDLLSISAHKACGPKGVGALCLDGKHARRIEPIMYGGGQQRGMRPGTLPVHQIVGMGAALKILIDEAAEEVSRVGALRDRLWQAISDVSGVVLNGDNDRRLCSILNVSVENAEGESLRFALNDLAVSGGSACNSASEEPSYVLRALGRSDVLIESSLRFSLGRYTTADEIDQAARSFRRGVGFLHSMAPAAGAA